MTKPAFICRMCGVCCEGRGGIVLSEKDLVRLADHMGNSVEDFLAGAAEVMSGKPVLKVGEDGFCLYYEQGLGCAVHEARPDVCRAWPYFTGNLDHESSWRMAAGDCRGINEAAGHEAFAREGAAYRLEHDLVRDSAGALKPARIERDRIVRDRDAPSAPSSPPNEPSPTAQPDDALDS